MKKIFVVTKARGFLLDLFMTKFKNAEFMWRKQKIYEVNSKLKLIATKIVRSKIGNYLGIIQRVNVKNEDFDIGLSFNRFLSIGKNYIILLENPTALFHYSLDRNKTFLGKRKIKKYLNDKNLRVIVCISKACYNTISNFYSIPKGIKVVQIYPLISKNNFTTNEIIKLKSYRKELKCLYVSSDFKLKGGRDIVECFRKLQNAGINNVSLKIITKLNSLDEKLLQEIKKINNVELHDFNYERDELQKVYSESNILLNPTRQDSFSMVVLEAIKGGNTVLSTDLYAIPEMVENNYNGFLIEPKYRFFTYDNMPNKNIWNNRKSTIYADYIDNNIVNFLYDKITYLNNNRHVLCDFSLNSFWKSTNGEFNEDFIKGKWEEIFDKL